MACGRRMRKRRPAEVDPPTEGTRVAPWVVAYRPGRGDIGQARLQVGVGDLPQFLADGTDRTDGRQALLGVVAVLA